jgi:hypothetical protein
LNFLGRMDIFLFSSSAIFKSSWILSFIWKPPLNFRLKNPPSWHLLHLLSHLCTSWWSMVGAEWLNSCLQHCHVFILLVMMIPKRLSHRMCANIIPSKRFCGLLKHSVSLCSRNMAISFLTREKPRRRLSVYSNILLQSIRHPNCKEQLYSPLFSFVFISQKCTAWNPCDIFNLSVWMIL